VRHDVGTITAASGTRLGEALDGFDTPSLRGVWRTAPYLHDGSAATLLDVLTTRNPDDQHGVTGALSPGELADLVAYMTQLDDSAVPFPDPASLVFADGFETGDAMAWSSTAP
jgi:cytochrome c peroxidase